MVLNRDNVLWEKKMALVSIEMVLAELKRYLKVCPKGGGMELMSYKRNRTIAVIKSSEDSLRIIEKGYIVEETTVKSAQLEKKLKKLMKREFPRSRKIRLHKFNHEDELERIHQKI